MVYLIFCPRRLPHLSRAEVQRHWRETQAPLVKQHAGALGVKGYMQVHTIDPAMSQTIPAARRASLPRQHRPTWRSRDCWRRSGGESCVCGAPWHRLGAAERQGGSHQRAAVPMSSVCGDRGCRRRRSRGDGCARWGTGGACRPGHVCSSDHGSGPLHAHLEGVRSACCRRGTGFGIGIGWSISAATCCGHPLCKSGWS